MNALQFMQRLGFVQSGLIKHAYALKWDTDKAVVFKTDKDSVAAVNALFMYAKKKPEFANFQNLGIGTNTRRAPDLQNTGNFMQPTIEELLIMNDISAELTVSYITHERSELNTYFVACRGTVEMADLEYSTGQSSIWAICASMGFSVLSPLKDLGIDMPGKIKSSIKNWLMFKTDNTLSLLQQFQAYIDSCKAGSNFSVSGHSLGGGEAIVLAIMAAKSGKFKLVTLHLFGSIAVLDADAALEFTKLNIACVNYQFKSDPIPGMCNAATFIAHSYKEYPLIKKWFELHPERQTFHVGNIEVLELDPKYDGFMVSHALDWYRAGASTFTFEANQQKGGVTLVGVLQTPEQLVNGENKAWEDLPKWDLLKQTFAKNLPKDLDEEIKKRAAKK